MKITIRNFIYSFIVMLVIGLGAGYFASKKTPQEHVIIISLDSVFEADFERLTSMPIIQELIDNGAYSNEVTTVYPSITYAIHTSIITGTYPDKHGVYHNQPLQPGVDTKCKEWFWYQENVKVPSLFDLLNENQYTVANIIWPVTGNGNMTYNLPQIFAVEGENQVIKTLKSGTPLFIIEEYLKYGDLLGDGEQPKLDKFTTAVAVDTIKNKKPNFLTLHLISVDTFRHDYGVNSSKVDDAFELHEKAIEKIVQATKEAGTYESTTFVITTDHGQIDVSQNVYLNNILQREGYITETEEGIEYKAIAQSTGLGAFIHIKDHDPLIKTEITQLLENLMHDKNYGIEKVYTQEELKKLHASSEYDLAIEAMPGYQFKDSLNQKDFEKTTGANHGYSPLKEGYKNIFIISGSKIKDNYNLGPINIVDIAPTISELLGFEFYECDGHSFLEKIKEES